VDLSVDGGSTNAAFPAGYRILRPTVATWFFLMRGLSLKTLLTPSGVGMPARLTL